MLLFITFLFISTDFCNFVFKGKKSFNIEIHILNSGFSWIYTLNIIEYIMKYYFKKIFFQNVCLWICDSMTLRLSLSVCMWLTFCGRYISWTFVRNLIKHYVQVIPDIDSCWLVFGVIRCTFGSAMIHFFTLSAAAQTSEMYETSD